MKSLAQKPMIGGRPKRLRRRTIRENAATLSLEAKPLKNVYSELPLTFSI